MWFSAAVPVFRFQRRSFAARTDPPCLHTQPHTLGFLLAASLVCLSTYFSLCSLHLSHLAPNACKARQCVVPSVSSIPFLLLWFCLLFRLPSNADNAIFHPLTTLPPSSLLSVAFLCFLCVLLCSLWRSLLCCPLALLLFVCCRDLFSLAHNITTITTGTCIAVPASVVCAV